jgi:hypothetical protein
MKARNVMSKALLAAPFALALAAAAGGCSPEVPANPTYTNDVRPIFMAHCVRCHGADEMLHTMQINGFPNSPSFCYLQRYDNAGDCSGNPADPAVCFFGASAPLCVTQVPSFISQPTDSPSRMPPPPSAPLNDWETDVIMKWTANGAPR